MNARANRQPAARRLAAFAASLRYVDIDPVDVAHAKTCVIDTVGVALLGRRFAWGDIAMRYAQRHGSGGNSRVLGSTARVSAPMAALANGVLAHSFEFDSLRKPGAGVHPGAALVPPALAVGEDLGASGRSVLAAIVAGCEVMFRIGAASRHTSESLGFHAPGLTGPFGAAIVAGHLLGLDTARMCNALGIAGSLCGGSLAFARTDNGSMVKRLHLGRAAEAGILAASLAAEGFEGPDTILDGEFGFLEMYCREGDASWLVRQLGEASEIRKMCIKRFPCHVTAQGLVHCIGQLRNERRFEPDAVREVIVGVGAKVLSHHADRDPADTMAAQYSVPFCVAVAILDDPMDPEAFLSRGPASAAVRELCRSIELVSLAQHAQARSPWAGTIELRLSDGTRVSAVADDFPGTPGWPLSETALEEKYARCAEGFEPAARLYDQLQDLDAIEDVRSLALS